MFSTVIFALKYNTKQRLNQCQNNIILHAFTIKHKFKSETTISNIKKLQKAEIPSKHIDIEQPCLSIFSIYFQFSKHTRSHHDYETQQKKLKAHLHTKKNEKSHMRTIIIT